jgi:small subunit ribosomal protein S20
VPITKSAKKALRQSEKRKARNIKQKEKIKGALREIRDLVTEKKIKEAKNILPRLFKLLDKGVKKGLIKANTAARKKSRITQLINKAAK